tara:strand:- start:774 stop:920 length:147 start_codon:yes stop_codon:yes gene_type:complete
MFALLISVTAGFGLYKMLFAGLDYLERLHRARQKAALAKLCQNTSDTL